MVNKDVTGIAPLPLQSNGPIAGPSNTVGLDVGPTQRGKATIWNLLSNSGTISLTPALIQTSGIFSGSEGSAEITFASQTTTAPLLNRGTITVPKYVTSTFRYGLVLEDGLISLDGTLFLGASGDTLTLTGGTLNGEGALGRMSNNEVNLLNAAVVVAIAPCAT